ncbi:PspC domain-containing protein [Demequina sp. NBRC 110057]|uniref:PspC domain-containing protein n=1 Tax=Demequina sp. NBRC 110057 TaxID=1570346 RepID=UPI000A04C668|nr:PspC domain-containing protein [Demequina sp. NBRC 110057]
MSETPQPPQEAAFFTAIRGWDIQRGDRLLGGVASGLGAKVGMAPVPARLLMVLAGVLLNGLVLLAYAAAWALLPDRHGSIVIQDFGRGVTNVGALIGIAIMGVLGFVTIDNGGLFGGIFGADPFPWDSLGNFGPFEIIAAFFGVMIPLAILGGLVFLIVYLVRRNKAGTVHSGPGGTYWTSQQQDSGATPPPYQAAADATAGAAEAAPGEDGEVHDEAPGEATSPEQPAAAAAAAAASATSATGTTGQPQPWEPALLPGDPRVTVPPRQHHQGRQNPHGTPAADPWASSYAWNASTGERSTTPAYAPARPPKPPRVPGPGKAAWLAFLGVLVIAVAVVFAIARSGQLAVSPVLAWGAIITMGLGAVLLVVALSGRRFGFLGFLSVCAVAVSIPMVANADTIRANYGDWGYWMDGSAIDYEEAFGFDDGGPEPEASATATGPEQVSIREAFGDDYTTIYAAGSCWDYSDSASEEMFGPADSYIQLSTVDEDMSIPVRGSTTEAVIPSGTSLIVTSPGSVTVDFTERQVWCDLWNDGTADSTVLDLAAGDGPVLTLEAPDVSTLYITEEVSQ